MVYGGPGVMMSPGAAAVTAGPDIVDIMQISVFLVFAAAAASNMLKGYEGVGSDVAGRDRSRGSFVFGQVVSSCESPQRFGR